MKQRFKSGRAESLQSGPREWCNCVPDVYKERAVSFQVFRNVPNVCA